MRSRARQCAPRIGSASRHRCSSSCSPKRRMRAERCRADSRALGLVKQHPGKMWIVEGKTMRPLLEQEHLDVAWHAGQYQALPPVYVQNSSLEIAWTRVVSQTGTREGKVVAPYFTEGAEGFNIDDEDDWEHARRLLDAGEVGLPDVQRP